MAPSTNNRRKLLEIRFKNERLEKFDGQRQLVQSFTQFMKILRLEGDEKIVLLKELGDLASHCSVSSRHSEEYRYFSQKFRSFMTKLEVFFRVQNPILTLINRNELVVVFIDLFLEILEEILCLQPNFILRDKDSIQTLEMELKFLITFLGDTPSQSTATELLDTTENVLTDIEDLAILCSDSSRRSEEYRNFCQILRSFMLELKVFFRVQNPILTLINRNELVAVFIDLFLEILEEILRLQPNFILGVKDSIQTLKMELKFLITFLGDTPYQSIELLDTTENILTDIEGVANDVGCFLYTLFFNGDSISVTDMDTDLSRLLKTLRLVTKKIIAHCTTITEMLPSCTTPNTDVVSLFLADSILDDLKNVKDDRIVSLKAQIHRQLMFLRSLLADMEEKRCLELEEFFIRIRDIAYEVEYVVSLFSPVQYLTIRLLQVIEKIKLVTIRLQEMKKKYDAGMLKDAEYPTQEILSQTRDTGDYVVLEDEVKKIEEQLLGNRAQIQIISIFGMPGLGKTALAKKLYNDSSIVQHFDKCGWCVVSQNYQIRNILTDILMSMDVEAMMDADEDTLGEALHKCLLTCRRYIIFIDDIWDVEAWNKIKTYIPDRKESRILFTTRDEDFASKASHPSKASLMENNALRRLTDEECWALLQRKVFQQNSCPEDLIVAGKEIARKCDGLPLAVVVIAAVLTTMQKERKLWEDVAKSISSYRAKESYKYMNTLELSYNYLPTLLKPCFLYLGTFEKNREIAVRKLILLWISEGFIGKLEESKETVTQEYLEHVAQEYLKLLINRSLVQVAQRRPDGGVKICRIHDLLRDMCLRISEEQNFLKVIQNGGAQFSQSWRERAAKGETLPESSLQRISSISIDDENDEKILKYSPNLRRLKCKFAVFYVSSEDNNRYPILNFLGQLESLSIFFLGGYAREDPSPDLTKLPLNLRRLTLSNFNLSLEQMKIIGNLLELEVLKLRGGTIKEKRWDTSEGEFKKLKFLELDEVQIEQWNTSNDHFPKLDRLVLRNCQHLEIPSDLGFCDRLLKIEVHGCEESVKRSALTIKEEQEEYSKDIEVIISHS